MADTLTPAARSERMARVRGINTRPELIVRRLVHGLGYRYRLHGRDLPGRPDLVFRSRRKVIFVHGCFWHRHGDTDCRLARLPKTRLDFWVPKLEANRQRDQRTAAALSELGWQQLIVWECEVKLAEQLKNRVRVFLEAEGDRDARH